MSWNDFKATMSDVYKTLPEPSKKQKEHWMKDELLTSRKGKMLGGSSVEVGRVMNP